MYFERKSLWLKIRNRENNNKFPFVKDKDEIVNFFVATDGYFWNWWVQSSNPWESKVIVINSQPKFVRKSLTFSSGLIVHKLDVSKSFVCLHKMESKITVKIVV